jgi:hypothetical protein
MPAKKKAVTKKATSKKSVSKKTVAKAIAKVPSKVIEEKHDVARKECEHCLGTGKCTAGEPYDKGHHQVFGSKVILTSCVDCLEAAGEHSNSKKLVFCRICGGTGEVEA